MVVREERMVQVATSRSAPTYTHMHPYESIITWMDVASTLDRVLIGLTFDRYHHYRFVMYTA